MRSTAHSEQRLIMLCAAAGMVGVFVVIALLVHVSGRPWSTAAAIAGLPTVFGGWYFGAILPLSRHDFSDEAPTTQSAHTGEGDVEHDAVKPAA